MLSLIKNNLLAVSRLLVRRKPVNLDYLDNQDLSRFSEQDIILETEDDSGTGRINLSNIFKLVDKIFVTEDSSSMISESISSGLDVYTIAPKRVKKNKDYLEMLYQYERMGFIKRLNFDTTFNNYANKSTLSAKYKKIRNAKHLLKVQILAKLNKLVLTKNIKTV